MSVYMVAPEYSVSALNSSVPPSILPSPAQRPIAGCSSNLVSIVSQSSTQQAGGLVQINVPNQPNTYIKAGSAFLKMVVNVTLSGTATGPVAIYGNNACKNWASLILRASLSSGPNILEQINQYSYYDELLNLHAGSNGYFRGNMKTLYGMQISLASAGAVANPVYSFTICIPVSFGLLNSPEEQHFPLGLLNSGVQIALDLQGDVNQAIYATSGAGITANTYSVSNCSFNYEAIKVPTEHFQSLRMEMAQSGSLYQLPYFSALNMSIAATNTVDQTLGVGLSSLKGVFTTVKPASAFGTEYLSTRGGLTQHRVLLDGQLINNYSLPQIQAGTSNADVEFFVELNRALGVLGSTNRTVGPDDFATNNTLVNANNNGTDLATKYELSYFWTGLACNRFSEHGLTYSGSPVSQVQVHGETITGTTYYIIMIYDSCLFVNSQGDCSINR
jgi:hypothetical protein